MRVNFPSYFMKVYKMCGFHCECCSSLLIKWCWENSSWGLVTTNLIVDDWLAIKVRPPRRERDVQSNTPHRLDVFLSKLWFIFLCLKTGSKSEPHQNLSFWVKRLKIFVKDSRKTLYRQKWCILDREFC